MDKLMYSPDETSRLIGICKVTLYKLLNEGKITGRRYGNRILIEREEIERYIKSLPVATFGANKGRRGVQNRLDRNPTPFPAPTGRHAKHRATASA